MPLFALQIPAATCYSHIRVTTTTTLLMMTPTMGNPVIYSRHTRSHTCLRPVFAFPCEAVTWEREKSRCKAT
ncbi:hypothetical protein L596_027302 [Steinernema carpocapsae]|uniref:Uncharacterized protein n=1 Tax=Steinernema carpocapsae TaxID=34508 RepID=A0A4U5M3Z3_STECR|nr:hypothetical protein L596_027302 [Steinernema carpocapsae]